MFVLAIFDMDGTILNTAGDLTDAVNQSLAEMGRRHDFTEDEVKLCFGSGIIRDMECVLALERGCPLEDITEIGQSIPISTYGITQKDVETLHALFSPWYAAHNNVHTAPYPGIPELLRTLREKGIRTAVASNKDEADVKVLADRLFPGLFDVVIGNTPAIRRKPAPDMVNAILQKENVSRETAVYVGDSEVDIETARNAHLPCLSVDWGFRTRSFLTAHGAAIIVSSADELLQHLI